MRSRVMNNIIVDHHTEPKACICVKTAIQWIHEQYMQEEELLFLLVLITNFELLVVPTLSHFASEDSSQYY